MKLVCFPQSGKASLCADSFLVAFPGAMTNAHVCVFSYNPTGSGWLLDVSLVICKSLHHHLGDIHRELAMGQGDVDVLRVSMGEKDSQTRCLQWLEDGLPFFKMPRSVNFICQCSRGLRHDLLLLSVREPAVEGRSKPSWALGPKAAFLAGGWASDLSPSRPKVLLKRRLMGVEPSVMRVDFRPRLWSSFTCISSPATARSLRVLGPRPSVIFLNFFTSTSASWWCLQNGH